MRLQTPRKAFVGVVGNPAESKPLIDYRKYEVFVLLQPVQVLLEISKTLKIAFYRSIL